MISRAPRPTHSCLVIFTLFGSTACPFYPEDSAIFPSYAQAHVDFGQVQPHEAAPRGPQGSLLATLHFPTAVRRPRTPATGFPACRPMTATKPSGSMQTAWTGGWNSQATCPAPSVPGHLPPISRDLQLRGRNGSRHPRTCGNYAIATMGWHASPSVTSPAHIGMAEAAPEPHRCRRPGVLVAFPISGGLIRRLRPCPQAHHRQGDEQHIQPGGQVE